MCRSALIKEIQVKSVWALHRGLLLPSSQVLLLLLNGHSLARVCFLQRDLLRWMDSEQQTVLLAGATCPIGRAILSALVKRYHVRNETLRVYSRPQHSLYACCVAR